MKYKARGVWIPIHLIQLRQDGQINRLEQELLALVDAFAKGKYAKCWASNAWLAKELDVEPRSVARMLGRLEQQGLLKRTYGERGQRFLETYYTNPIHFDTPITGVTLGSHPEGGDPGVMGGMTVGSPNRHYEIDISNTYGKNAAKRNSPKDSKMGFVQDTDTTPPRESLPDQDRADTLRATLANHRRLSSKYSKATWAAQFRLLRDKDKQPQDEIDATLAWMGVHAADEFTPRVYNAEEFRQKYPRLRDAMLRAGAVAKRVAPVEVTEKAKEIIKELGGVRNFKWPENTDPAQFGALVQLSYDALCKYKLAIRELGRNNPDPKRYPRLAQDCKMIWDKLLYPSEMAKWWVHEVHTTAHEWGEWGGNLRNWVWSTDRRPWRWMVIEWAMEWCGQRDGLDYIDDLLRKAEQSNAD